MSRHAWILVLLSACGEPVLRNAPRPNPAAAAGVAAAAAAAVTLASPRDAAKQQEALAKPDPDDRGVQVKETVPGAVFDRIDQGGDAQGGDAGVDGGAPAVAPAAAPARGTPTQSVPAPQAWTPPTTPR
jgi:hypothetical protein